jgi:hypothetical protein
MTETENLPDDARWDEELAALLADLSDVQQEILDYLAQKREFLCRGDMDGLADQQQREADLVVRLEACHDRRQELLKRASDEGCRATSLQQLSATLEAADRERISPILSKAANRARLLRHHSLTNWVLAQRHLMHVSCLIEILATGGKPRPTYGEGSSAPGSGALVDQAV